MSLPLVELRAVTKSFATRKPNPPQLVLDQIDLTIRAAEFVSLLGPSGCGKSTILRIVAGLSEPSSGEVLRNQGDASQSVDRRLACVFQEPTLLPWCRVRENVYLPLRLAGVSWTDAEQRVEESLARVGLKEAANKYPRQLSGGMKMRVSIARALATQPQLLLLDEPFAALDEITRLRLNDELLGLREEFGFGVLFITHSVFESVYLSDRIIVMGTSPGRLVREMEIDLPQPRGESTRALPRYTELCQHASDALQLDNRVLPMQGGA